MLWEDGSADSWLMLGVRGQPAWMLMDANGQTLITPRFGAIDENAVLERLST